MGTLYDILFSCISTHFSYIFMYFQSFQCIFVYFHSFSYIFMYFHAFSRISMYFRVFSLISLHFRVFPRIFTHLRCSKRVLCTGSRTSPHTKYVNYVWYSQYSLEHTIVRTQVACNNYYACSGAFNLRLYYVRWSNNGLGERRRRMYTKICIAKTHTTNKHTMPSPKP